MEAQRTYMFKLEPAGDQAALLLQFAGACRALRNAALPQRRQWSRTDRPILFSRRVRRLSWRG